MILYDIEVVNVYYYGLYYIRGLRQSLVAAKTVEKTEIRGATQHGLQGTRLPCTRCVSHTRYLAHVSSKGEGRSRHKNNSNRGRSRLKNNSKIGRRHENNTKTGGSRHKNYIYNISQTISSSL